MDSRGFPKLFSFSCYFFRIKGARPSGSLLHFTYLVFCKLSFICGVHLLQNLYENAGVLPLDLRRFPLDERLLEF